MRLVTWNMAMRTKKCLDHLNALRADVIVLQEVNPDHVGLTSRDRTRQRWGTAPSGKGFGVIVREGLRLTDMDPDPLPWCLPVHVGGDGIGFVLAAMWAITYSPQKPSYTEQLAAVVDRYAGDPNMAPLVIAGDMNASAQQATHQAHLANVRAVRDRDLESAYHWRHGHADDADVPTTLRWVSKPDAQYHCDLVFLPPEWRLEGTRVSLGDPDVVFGQKLSDHLPVIVDVPLEGHYRPPAVSRFGADGELVEYGAKFYADGKGLLISKAGGDWVTASDLATPHEGEPQ
ncbi:MAG: hypothetical protein QG597_611 [Actinomycetota bacterium]|nr:hypothetical protein [Actinomycetota bacterium]